MAGLLESLSQGLRGAGAVFSEDVYRSQGREEQIAQQLQQQQKMLMLQQLIKAGESGAAPPEVVAQQVKQLTGMDLPIGPDAATQQRQAQVQNELGFRQAISGAGGDMTKIAAAAAQYGKPEVAVSIYNQQEARADRRQQAADALDVRKDQLTQAHEARLQGLQNQQERNAEIARHNKMMEGLTEQSRALQASVAQSHLELKRLGLTMGADRAAQAEQDRTDKDVNRRTQMLSGALEKANLPEVDSVLGAVEKAVDKRKDLGAYLSGPKSLIPDMAVDPDIRDGRQAFQKLFNITLKNRSGAAVTLPEFERLKAEFGNGVFKTPDQIQNGLKQARDIISNHYASVASGFGPDALDKYNENVRGFGGRVVLDPKQKREASPAASGGWSVVK